MDLPSLELEGELTFCEGFFERPEMPDFVWTQLVVPGPTFTSALLERIRTGSDEERALCFTAVRPESGENPVGCSAVVRRNLAHAGSPGGCCPARKAVIHVERRRLAALFSRRAATGAAHSVRRPS